MAPAEEPKMDEIAWSDPGLVQYYQGIHTESVHLYFYHSPFCDKTSSNWTLFVQSMNNYQTKGAVLHSRELFEAEVRDIGGLEYMVVSGPQKLANGEESGIWVIRKQQRNKRGPNRVDEEVEVLGTYFIIGDRIFQAPSVEDILRCRLLSITTNLSKFTSKASSLPHFTPGTGYTYLPPATKTSSTAGPGSQSRTISPVLGESTSQTNSTTVTKSHSSTTQTSSSSSRGDERLLFESLTLAMRFTGEYMDENPIIGEPGSFVFSATKERVQAQKEQERIRAEAAAAAAIAARQSAASKPPTGAAAATGASTTTATPVVRLDTANLPLRKGTKASPLSAGPGKLKRKRSKAPTAPGTPADSSPAAAAAS